MTSEYVDYIEVLFHKSDPICSNQLGHNRIWALNEKGVHIYHIGIVFSKLKLIFSIKFGLKSRI